VYEHNVRGLEGADELRGLLEVGVGAEGDLLEGAVHLARWPEIVVISVGELLSSDLIIGTIILLTCGVVHSD
jgi:hypothetical protein